MPCPGSSKLEREAGIAGSEAAIAGSVPDTSVLKEKIPPPKSLGGSRSKSATVVRGTGLPSRAARRGSIKVLTRIVTYRIRRNYSNKRTPPFFLRS